MKKKILALALVLVTLVTVLTGCAYRYDNKDMSKYAKADYAGLTALLKSITVEGDDFGPYLKDSTVRDDQVLEKIDSTLAGKIDTTTAAKLKGDAVYGLRQKIYYAFYCAAEKDGVTYLFDTKNMDDTKLTNFLSNPTYTNGKASEDGKLALDSELTQKIFDAIKGLKATDYAYDSESTGTLAAGDQVFVSYKYTYSEDGTNKSASTDYMLITVAEAPAEGAVATKIEQLLAGKSIGKIEGTTENPLKFTDAVKGECSVASMTVHFRIKSGKCVEVKDTLTADKTIASVADTAGEVKFTKDTVVTYYVYPAYAYEVEEFNADSVIKTIFGESISTSSLDIFTENEKMEELIKDVVDLKSKYDQANSKVTSAGSSATEEQKNTRDQAKTKLEDAVKALPGKLYATGTEADVKKLIVDEYKASVYETLETSHDATVRTQLGKAIWEWVEKNVKVDEANLPKRAVKEARERILAVHKNDYYTGQDSTTNVAYAETYKTFSEYLAAVAYKDEDVDASVEAEAKAEVVEIIRVYAVAQQYEDQVKKVTKADISIYIDEIYPSLYYTFYLQGNYNPTVNDVLDYYGETAIRCSLTFDRIMDYFLATEEVDGHVKYTNITVKYAD
ncbi:MAG: hypothetical protein J6K14_08705 [Clostridia bacterium]|nr:hypothetical protein [Clostridia bacterium]